VKYLRLRESPWVLPMRRVLPALKRSWSTLGHLRLATQGCDDLWGGATRQSLEGGQILSGQQSSMMGGLQRLPALLAALQFCSETKPW